MSKATLFVDSNGHVTGLHTDMIPLEKLGKLDIKRASNIEFNNRKGVWEVEIAGWDGALFSSTSREQCLKWERRYINNILEMQRYDQQRKTR